MGMKLIDADAIMTSLYRKYGAIDAIDDIMNAPTVDAEPVRHGRWLKSRAMVGIDPITLDFKIDDTDKCSLCDINFISVPVKYRFCPSCGAKMDEEKRIDEADKKGEENVA